ncbi:MAG: type II toxin-antitoxin system VapC family toxin [Acidobacteria bacterium]|nr:type II toxin-antitoxin system VapC family toxin [Acidobacteriota bacterium]
MNACVTDTHALVWFVLDAPELSADARQAMLNAAANGEPVFMPSICLVELVYLIEKGRIPKELLKRIKQTLANPNSELTVYHLTEVVAESLELVPRKDVPDMPDRIIAATALHLGLPLVTRDGKIRAANITTIW